MLASLVQLHVAPLVMSAGFLAASFASTVSAQRVADPEVEKPEEPGPQQPAPLAKPAKLDPEEERKRERESRITAAMTDMLYQSALTRLLVEIDEYKRIGGLDEADAKRLELAAKGAASQFAEKQVVQDTQRIIGKIPPLAKRFSTGVRIVELPVQPSDDDKEDETADPEDVDPLNVYPRIELILGESSLTWYYREPQSSSGWGNGGGFMQVVQSGVWTKAVDKCITGEQQQKVAAHRASQLRAAAVDLCLAMLSANLRLDAEQSEQMRATLGAAAKELEFEPNDFRNRGWGVTRKLLQQNELPGFEELLSEPQRSLWKQTQVAIQSGNF